MSMRTNGPGWYFVSKTSIKRWRGTTNWCATTVRISFARLHRMNSAHSVHIVNNETKGKLPIGCGFGDSLGSGALNVS